MQFQSQLALLEQHTEGTEQKQAGEERRSGKEGVEYKGRQNKDALSLIANLQARQEAPDTGQNPLNKHKVKSAVHPNGKYIEYAWRVNHQVCTEKQMVVLGLSEMPQYFHWEYKIYDVQVKN